jgi:spermidine/putrescine transport system permease protein
VRELVRGYGRALVAIFFGAVAAWGLLLILFPQVTMIDRALSMPNRQLDSSIAFQLARDANTCISVLDGYDTAQTAAPENGGMGIPSASGMGIPSMTGATQGTATRPYILQCERTTTHTRMVRDSDEPVWFDELFGLPLLSVDDTLPIAEQKAQAAEIEAIARDLSQRLQAEEATGPSYSMANFDALFEARMIPMSSDQRAIEDAKLSKKLMQIAGLRFERDGAVYERIGALILIRTILFAVAATLLALILCYPIAFKLALATPPQRAVWLFLGLVIPYAIVELMRIYAWTAIIDNNGVINSVLMWLGVIADPIQFKRYAMTVFVVIVYTYVLFMVFPMYNVMATLDKNQIEAAEDLGASSWRVHTRVIIPHAKPGIAVGAIATFMLCAGAFSVPRIISAGCRRNGSARPSITSSSNPRTRISGRPTR